MAKREDDQEQIQDLPTQEPDAEQVEAVRGGDGSAGDDAGTLKGLVSPTNIGKTPYKTSTTSISTTGTPVTPIKQ